jgi:hypothetical protein
LQKCFWTLFHLKFVSNASHGVNDIEPSAKLISDAPDVGIHNPRISEEVFTPYLIENGIPCQNDILVSHKQQQYGEFGGRQAEGFTIHHHLAGWGVDDKIRSKLIDSFLLAKGIVKPFKFACLSSRIFGEG